MLFTSWVFVPFILLVLFLYYVLPFRWQNRMLLVASGIFYGWWDWRFLILLLVSTSIDFFIGLKLIKTEDEKRRKHLLFLSMTANLGILAFFKYFNFFIASTTDLLHTLHIPAPVLYLNVLLPVGISFYTFHAMSYTIDIYRHKMTPISDFLDYMLFVLYFPQLVAGPIARAAALIPQVVHPRKVTRDQIAEGLWLILWGYFKKMIVADNLAPLVNQVFDARQTPGGAQCLFAVYAFAFQIYCDFSGYTDIARGLGKLMGFELALNFNLPYIARNPPEFWHRWHISLSTWLRDYLYIPLGGNRHGTAKTYRNLMLTMLIGGLWHGAAWHFVLWGGYHGLLLSGHRLLFGDGRKPERARKPNPFLRIMNVVLMFHATCLGWLFFRAASLVQVKTILVHIFTDFVLDTAATKTIASVAIYVGMLCLLEAWIQNADDPRKRPLWNWGAGPLVVSALFLLLLILMPETGTAFLYFQF